ncbi:MAG TPA: Ldh family oxidoreductase [Xanthobacteraceae bacterium]|jgi:ureidoglycolate dehydrogenase (NAD+)|nr:Ldh family oxidoreductase [Xanthobacteraceae bacterium]
MSREKIVVGYEELKRFIHDVLIIAGASDADADNVADGLIWANLRGVDGHGISRLPRYLKYIDSGEIDVKAQPQLIVDRAAMFMIEGHHGFGPVAAMQASALAVERAKRAGVCYGLVRETTHTGAIGRYAQWIAERDCAAIVIGAGQTLMAYHGARVASLGTSPIAIAAPSGNGPIVLDMATSTISNGKILQARVSGEPLPEGTVLNAAGEATTDPRTAEILLPLGGPKGSGLSFMFEMLASVLGAAPIQTRVLGPERRRRHTSNLAVIAIDVAAFRPFGEFVSDADMLAALIKALPRQEGFDEILLPGERSSRTEATRRKSGIPLPAKLWDELEAIAKPQSIRMPERLGLPPR